MAIGDFTELGGAQAMRALLADWPDLDAVFVANDLMARGALQVLAEAGRSVPATSPWSATTTARPRPLCSRSCPRWPSRRS